ncbi:MAG: radical SAM protein [Candidatus Zixiibacteriota bacterium]
MQSITKDKVKFPTSDWNMKHINVGKRLKEVSSALRSCCLCGNLCRANRLKGEKGRCNSDSEVMVSSYNLHFGEEPPISGKSGSGTIFFTNCSLRCVYCQNFPISQLGNGNVVTTKRLARMMMELQAQGAHNINLVTPTHYIPQIVEAIFLARKRGLGLPLVYNTSGYESREGLRLLRGVIDIYLVDMRYSDNQVAERYSGVNNYAEINRSAVEEMYSQVGNLITDDQGLARSGLIIRHMVLPSGLSGSERIFEFISQKISDQVWVSLMDQYFPAYRAQNHHHLKRKTTLQEYLDTEKSFFDSGLKNGWVQKKDNIV